jgi:ElaB/YqjD/DUF883 family membrane-anchored ribosome-binding protein
MAAASAVEGEQVTREAEMNAASDKSESTQDTGALPRSTVSDAMESAVPGQPPLSSSSSANADSERSELRNEGESSSLTRDVVKGVFANAQDALKSGYRTVSSSTDDFVHESPWKSIAFAVLGGVIVGMLAAR